MYMQIRLPSLVLRENSIIFIHVDDARKANLHAYKIITIRPAIYERGLHTLASTFLQSLNW